MKDVKFIKSVKQINQLPKLTLPEIVLAGRSNVGKSSFINNLFGRKNLAKTSSSPGKTQSINYYKVDDKFYFVDLPGYGYAKVSKTERKLWQKLINDYFAAEREIVTVFHFIDARHHPTELDLILNDYLKSINLPYTIVLNKIDKLKQSEISKRKNEIKEYFPELSLGDNLLLYSSIKGIGKKEVSIRLRKLFY